MNGIHGREVQQKPLRVSMVVCGRSHRGHRGAPGSMANYAPGNNASGFGRRGATLDISQTRQCLEHAPISNPSGRDDGKRHHGSFFLDAGRKRAALSQNPPSLQDGELSGTGSRHWRVWLISEVAPRPEQVSASQAEDSREATLDISQTRQCLEHAPHYRFVLKGRRRTSPKIFFIIFDMVLLEKGHVFLLKCFGPMMRTLIRDVCLDRPTVGYTHGEGTISRLPAEIPHPDGFVNPTGGRLLDVLDE